MLPQSVSESSLGDPPSECPGFLIAHEHWRGEETWVESKDTQGNYKTYLNDSVLSQ